MVVAPLVDVGIASRLPGVGRRLNLDKFIQSTADAGKLLNDHSRVMAVEIRTPLTAPFGPCHLRIDSAHWFFLCDLPVWRPILYSLVRIGMQRPPPTFAQQCRIKRRWRVGAGTRREAARLSSDGC